MDWDALFDAARAARERAYAPYSRFQVGAALLTGDGTLIPGCNVENRSFGLCICAERTAVSSAVAAGHREFVAVAVVTDTAPPAVPCGMCPGCSSCVRAWR
ncbi:MAG: cytidine deaminase [Acidobacteriota bacterium]